MKNGTITLIFIILLCSSCGHKNNNEKEVSKWIEYHTKDSLPSTVLGALDHLAGDTFDIADFNQPYQASDVNLDSNLPLRQLCYVGRIGNKWQMAYRHGGIGMHFHLLNFEINSGEVLIRNLGTSLSQLVNRGQIDSALANRKIDLKTPSVGDVKDL